MEPSNTRSLSHGLAVLLALFLFVSFMGIFQQDLAAEDAEGVSRVSEVCLNCHDGFDKSLANSPHHISKDALNGPDAPVTCTDCHHGDARHYEDDPEQYPMMIPAAAEVPDEAEICSTCHLTGHQQNMMENNVHARNDVNCSGCHKIHDSEEVALLKDKQVDMCMSCHPGVEGQFAQPYRHPVNDDIVLCSECHMTLDDMQTELAQNGSDACTECHYEFQGPFPFEHQAAVDYSTEEGGCVSCHSPHGSAQPRMLKQPYEPPHYQLCTQCHSVPPGHNYNTHHGTEWAGMACNECHTDIHGSYFSRSLLSEALEAQGCFTVGCHPPGR